MAGAMYKPSLFLKSGSIFISSDTKPSHNDLELLLTLSGAKVIDLYRIEGNFRRVQIFKLFELGRLCKILNIRKI